MTQAKPTLIYIHQQITGRLNLVKESGGGEGQAHPVSFAWDNSARTSTLPQRRCLGSRALFSGGVRGFVFPSVRLMLALPVTYPRDYSDRESRLRCSRGGRNSPGTSRSGRHLCSLGSWYSGPRGRWTGRVQGQSSTPVSGHYSHRLLAKKTYE